METVTIRMKLLTPVHIGTGEDYEPTNFIIDDEVLYEFDEMRFFENLDEQGKADFLTKVESTAPEALFELHSFVKRHKAAAKKAAILRVKVTSGIEKDYQNKIGRAVQKEGRVKQKVFNRFQIPRTLRLSNGKRYPYIPGSSIKGSISTAIQEAYYREDMAKYKEIFEVRNPSMSAMKNLLISDAVPIRIGSKIGYSLNKERFEDDKEGPKNKIEVIVPGSEFEVQFSTRHYEPSLPLDIELLHRYSNEHYLPLFQSMMSSYNVFKGERIDDYTNEYFGDDFYDQFKDLHLEPNQFLLRVGKHSGARAVTVDGMRKIQVKVSGGGPKRKPNKWETLDQETTTWLFGEKESQVEGLLPFGWVICEIKKKEDRTNENTIVEKRISKSTTNTKEEEDTNEEEKCIEAFKASFENDALTKTNLDCFFEEIYHKEAGKHGDEENKSVFDKREVDVLSHLFELSATDTTNKIKDLISDTKIPNPTIESISFNNFKSFGEVHQKFTYKPITLVYAPNSVGKSSFQHAIIHMHYFLKKHFKTKIISLEKTKLFGDEIDLGGFENYIHQHDLTNEIEYKINLKMCQKAYLRAKGYTEGQIVFENFFISLIEKKEHFLQFLIKTLPVFKYEFQLLLEEYGQNEISNYLMQKVIQRRKYSEEESTYEILIKLKYVILYHVSILGDKEDNEIAQSIFSYIEKSFFEKNHIFFSKIILTYK
jgi:CRISPR-associated protein Csm5